MRIELRALPLPLGEGWGEGLKRQQPLMLTFSYLRSALTPSP